MRLPSLNHMVEHAIRTARRFPAEILVAFVGTVSMMTMLFLNDTYSLPDEQERRYVHIALSCVLLLNVALSLTIAYEARRITALVRWILLAVVGGALTWFVFRLTSADWDAQLFAAAALGVHTAVALSAAWNRSRRGFWEFNKTLFLRTLTGALFTIVLAGGISLALVSLDQLFNVDVDSWMYGWTWVFLIGVFNTLFVLGGIPPTPVTFDADAAVVTDEAATYPRGLRIFTQFVLLPLVIIFLCILYAYGVKVLFFAALEGGVSTFILSLSVAGILAYLLVYPLRKETEYAWIALYARWFGRLMVPLSAMLWVAIIVRVDAYGITEERYAVIALACVLSLVSVYLAVWRDPDLRVVPALLLVASVLAFVGPFNMTSVSYNSQTKRANNVLASHNIITNGQVDANAAAKLSKDDAEVVRSVVYYLDSYADSSRMRTWLEELGIPTPNRLRSDSVLALLGVRMVPSGRSSYTMHFTSTVSPTVNWVTNGTVQPFSWRGDLEHDSTERMTFHDDGEWSVFLNRDQDLIWVVSDPNGNKDSLVFTELRRREEDDYTSLPLASYSLTAEFPTRRVRFAFTQLSAYMDNSKWLNYNAEGLIIIERK